MGPRFESRRDPERRGGFGPPQAFRLGGISPFAVATADFNHDGKADLAVASQNANSVSVLLGRGDGTFKPHQDFDAGLYPYGIATGDFTGDGK